ASHQPVTEESPLILRRFPTIDFDTRGSTWLKEESIRKDRVGDAWHNLTAGFDTGVLHYPILSLIPSILISGAMGVTAV
ncbi:hypothetical protein L0F63_006520, partial [Massospora cicadina]